MIYFITARDVGRVKIGFSDEPRQRFMSIQTGSPVTLEMERLCEGDMAAERALHERFAASRIRGEWFALSPEIEAHMATLERAPAIARRSLTQELAAVTGTSISYANMMLSGARPLPLAVAIAFHNATGEVIGALEDADDHEIEVLKKFIEPWTSQRKAKAA